MNKFLIIQIFIYLTLYIGYGLFYMNRKAIVQISPFIVSSTNLTKDDIGLIITTQNFAYTLSKFLSGFMADVYSCRILFGSGLLLTSLVNICFVQALKVIKSYIITH
jgi:sugar phosphate permease